MKETFLPVSAILDEVSYDSETQTLTITFKAGTQYEYTGVPQEVYMGLQRSPSAGSYFYRNIRNRYNYTEI